MLYESVWRLARNIGTVSQADGSGATALPLIISDAPSLKSRREANEFVTALVPVGSGVVAGQLVTHPAAGWFLVQKL